eukprot:g15677.t1
MAGRFLGRAAFAIAMWTAKLNIILQDRGLVAAMTPFESILSAGPDGPHGRSGAGATANPSVEAPSVSLREAFLAAGLRSFTTENNGAGASVQFEREEDAGIPRTLLFTNRLAQENEQFLDASARRFCPDWNNSTARGMKRNDAFGAWGSLRSLAGCRVVYLNNAGCLELFAHVAVNMPIQSVFRELVGLLPDDVVDPSVRSPHMGDLCGSYFVYHFGGFVMGTDMWLEGPSVQQFFLRPNVTLLLIRLVPPTVGLESAFGAVAGHGVLRMNLEYYAANRSPGWYLDWCCLSFFEHVRKWLLQAEWRRLTLNTSSSSGATFLPPYSYDTEVDVYLQNLVYDPENPSSAGRPPSPPVDPVPDGIPRPFFGNASRSIDVRFGVGDPEYNYRDLLREQATSSAFRWISLQRRHRILLLQAIDDPFVTSSSSHQIVVDYFGRVFFRHFSSSTNGTTTLLTFHEDYDFCGHDVKRILGGSDERASEVLGSPVFARPSRWRMRELYLQVWSERTGRPNLSMQTTNLTENFLLPGEIWSESGSFGKLYSSRYDIGRGRRKWWHTLMDVTDEFLLAEASSRSGSGSGSTTTRWRASPRDGFFNNDRRAGLNPSSRGPLGQPIFVERREAAERLSFEEFWKEGVRMYGYQVAMMERLSFLYWGLQSQMHELQRFQHRKWAGVDNGISWNALRVPSQVGRQGEASIPSCGEGGEHADDGREMCMCPAPARTAGHKEQKRDRRTRNLPESKQRIFDRVFWREFDHGGRNLLLSTATKVCNFVSDFVGPYCQLYLRPEWKGVFLRKITTVKYDSVKDGWMFRQEAGSRFLARTRNMTTVVRDNAREVIRGKTSERNRPKDTLYLKHGEVEEKLTNLLLMRDKGRILPKTADRTYRMEFGPGRSIAWTEVTFATAADKHNFDTTLREAFSDLFVGASSSSAAPKRPSTPVAAEAAQPKAKKQRRLPAASPNPKDPGIVMGRNTEEEIRANNVIMKLDSDLQAHQNEPAADRKKVFRKLCLEWHPDKRPSDAPFVAKRAFQFLQERKDWFLKE